MLHEAKKIIVPLYRGIISIAMHENAKFVFYVYLRSSDNFTALAALTIRHLQKAMKVLSYFYDYFFANICQTIALSQIFLQKNANIFLLCHDLSTKSTIFAAQLKIGGIMKEALLKLYNLKRSLEKKLTNLEKVAYLKEGREYKEKMYHSITETRQEIEDLKKKIRFVENLYVEMEANEMFYSKKRT